MNTFLRFVDTVVGRFDRLTVFGLIAVSLMLLFYALEPRSPVFVLAFAGACVMGSAYGFMQGAWPFGLVEAVWSVVALRRWCRSGRGRAVPAQELGRAQDCRNG